MTTADPDGGSRARVTSCLVASVPELDTGAAQRALGAARADRGRALREVDALLKESPGALAVTPAGYPLALVRRFKPVSAASTPFAIDDLIDRYKHAVAAGEHHPVLLSGLFILDLLVVHPFEDGNGRVARLLTGAMLSEHGYTVGRYVSLEQAIAESADAYYQALLDSTHGWHEDTSDPWAWLGYFTSVIAGAYAVFADRATAAQTPGTKQQRVREHILRHAPATFRLADIRTAVPGVSDQTIRLVLEQLRSEGTVRADGTGRSATWTRANTARSE